MPLEAIKTVNEAEDTAKKAKAEAIANAKKTIDSAVQKGEELVKSESEKAMTEVRGLIEAAGQKAKENAQKLNETTANKAATIVAHAQSQMDHAVKIILERIVNS